MKVSKNIIRICLLGLFLVPAISAVSFSYHENVFHDVLDNGMQVLIKEDRNVNIVEIELWVKAGSIYEDEYIGSGISHFVEHMLFKGTKKRKVGDIAKQIKAAGGEINGRTSFETTVYDITISKEHLGLAIDILADAAMNSSFDSGEVEKERDVILKELNMNRDNPDKNASRIFWENAYRVHPYRHPVIGYKNCFRKIKRKDLLKYYKKMYVPNNMVLVIVGNVDRKEVYKKVEEAFRGFKRDEIKPILVEKEPRQLSRIDRMVEADVSLSRLKMGFHGPAIFSEDIYGLDVLAAILGEGRSSRLVEKIREKYGLVHSISAWSYTPAYEGVFVIEAILDHEKFNDTIEETLDIIEFIKIEGVTAEEIEKAKKMILKGYIFSLQTVEGQARDIASNFIITGDYNYTKTYLEGISKVSEKDVLQAAHKYLTSDNLTVVGLVPKGKGELETEAKASQKTQVKKYKLDNGINVLIREDHSKPIVVCHAVFWGGVRFEDKFKNGISNFVSQMLLRGTLDRTRSQIAAEIESHGGSISNFSGRNSLGLSMGILSENFNKGLDIFSDIVQTSAFVDEEIEKQRTLIYASIKNQKDKLLTYARNLLRETVYEKHPYRLDKLGTEDSVMSIKREDLVLFYETVISPENMVLSIYGDVDENDVLRAVKEKFAAFKPIRHFKPELAPEPPQKESRTREALRRKEQTIIAIGFHGVNIYNDDKYTLEVISNILSGMGGRLFKSLREEKPYTYFIGSSSIPGIENGEFIFYAGTIEEKKDEIIEGIFNEIKRLQIDLINDEELQRAKRNLIGQKNMALQTLYSQSFDAVLNELYGLGYDDIENYEDKINEVTYEDVKAAAEKYFDLNKFNLVVVKPSQ